jgi:hypothetical protein
MTFKDTAEAREGVSRTLPLHVPHLRGFIAKTAGACSNVAPNPLRRRRSKRLRPRTPFGAGLVRAPRPLTRAAAPTPSLCDRFHLLTSKETA